MSKNQPFSEKKFSTSKNELKFNEVANIKFLFTLKFSKESVFLKRLKLEKSDLLK